MNILVLGATSRIGSEIAAVLSPGNDLLLVGRDTSRLQQAADRCRECGAQRINQLASDLRQGSGDILRAVSNWQIDVIINSASATSRLRDDEIAVDKLADYVMVDVLAPLQLVAHLRASQPGRPLSIVFVSTVLTVVRSPNRIIYSNLKAIHERCLRALAQSHHELYVLIVKVAKVIPPDIRTPDTEKLAKVVRKAFERRKTTIFYGLAGRLLTVLFYTQPLFFGLAVKMRRMFSPALGRRHPEA